MEIKHEFTVDQYNEKQSQEILETIMSMSDQHSTIVSINFSESSYFHIVGGHKHRAIVIMSDLVDSKGQKISGRLIDSTVLSIEDEVNFAVGPEEADDEHQLMATSTKAQACEVVKYYLEHRKLPKDAKWGMPPFT